MNLNLEEMRNVDVRTVERETLVDIRSVVVDETLPRAERERIFVSQIGNPYCYRYKNLIIKTSHADTDATMNDVIRSLLDRQ
jgi:hypothetical protein